MFDNGRKAADSLEQNIDIAERILAVRFDAGINDGRLFKRKNGCYRIEDSCL